MKTNSTKMRTFIFCYSQSTTYSVHHSECNLKEGMVLELWLMTDYRQFDIATNISNSASL